MRKTTTTIRTMKYIIDNERYGVRSEFDSLQAAVDGIRACGPEFAQTDFSVRADGQILDEDGVIVGETQ